ncbi:MAG TPA: glycosyltransferase [Bdellovibrionales bacterium]|nr:glycosyltransferase [Bdellovibrionales bacterium]
MHWLLLGASPLPGRNPSSSISYLRLSDAWNYYVDPSRVETSVKDAISSLVDQKKVNAIFQPLQFTFAPYFEHLRLPSLKSVHLVTAELLQSAERQPYASHSYVRGSLGADQVRLKHEKRFIEDGGFFLLNSRKTQVDVSKHYDRTLWRAELCSSPGAATPFFDLCPPDYERRALFFGRFNHQKGIPLLLRSVPSSWELRCMGYGKWTSEDFAPYGIQVESWKEGGALLSRLKEATFCLFPSHYEPWGLSLTEALAAGRICVAQKGAGGHEEQLMDGENGFLIDFASGNFWEFLEELHGRGPDYLSRVSQAARASARPWTRHLEEIMPFLEDFCARH